MSEKRYWKDGVPGDYIRDYNHLVDLISMLADAILAIESIITEGRMGRDIGLKMAIDKICKWYDDNSE